MANLSNINNKLIVTDGGNLLVNATANLATYGGITIDNFSDPSIAMKTTSASGWLWTQYVTSTGTNNFSTGVNQTIPYWCVKAGAGMDSPHLVVDSSGDVGIGTISPAAKLEVYAGASTTQDDILWGGIIRNNANSAVNTGYGAGLKLKLSSDTAGEINKWAGIAGVAGSTFSNVTDLAFYANPTASNVPIELMRLTGEGNVGIGTDSPGYKLDVDNDVAGDWVTRIKNDSATGYGLYVESSSNAAQYMLGLHNGLDYQFIVNGAGYVGIGITTPQTTLQVNGAASAFNAHFGQGQNNSSGVFGGISLGYAENANAAYRKVAIVAQAKGDGAARQDLHFLVDTVADSNSAGIADSKMSIQYNTGDVIINNKLAIGTTSPQGKLDSVAPVADLTDFGRATGSALNIRIGNVIGYLGQINFCNDAAPAFGYGSIGMVMTSGSGVGLADMVFGTKSSGAAAVSTERMRIYSTGGVEIAGDLSVGGANKARFKSDGTNTYVDAIPANSEIRFRVDGAVEKFRIAASGATTQTMDGTTSLSHLWSQSIPLQNIWYTVYTYSQYDSVCFLAMVSFENDAGDGANQSAIFATGAGPAYGAAFAVEQISGGTGIEARRSSTSFQVRQTIGAYTASTRLNVRFVSIN